ncbi:DUF1707 domain-containing protein [Umezawaea sp. Da 62-37]|uniref:DUF1707 SHOCT-like domain-containing protein n=1 Tax=Umezawaea sp. Da 62-37 TaxID=3075927 RepID=UPI0028F71E7E|nr:DUF1707 domain-containing protein [Umezawaea sp. Da 62-37]WNV91386.1 DUF1707 domain-containing protein [Umezawaea sp. Da 62-37]
MTDPKDYRVSDAEREHVIGLLQKAIGQGLITLDEFSSRTDVALVAKTRGELNAVLLDLPGMTHNEQAPKAVAHGDRVEIKSTMSTVNRKGRWAVPRELVVRNRMGSTELDFSEAEIPHAVVTVELDVTAGSVSILLPEGATVNTDDIQMSAGSITDKAGTGEGRPHFVLTGVVRAGSVQIKRVRMIRMGAYLVRMPGFRVTKA